MDCHSCSAAVAEATECCGACGAWLAPDREDRVRSVLDQIDARELPVQRISEGQFELANGWRFLAKLADGQLRLTRVETPWGHLERSVALSEYSPLRPADWGVGTKPAGAPAPANPQSRFGQAGDFSFIRRAFAQEGVVPLRLGPPVPFRRVRAGEVFIKGGRWQLADVDESTRLSGFDLEIPRGTYPVYLTLARPGTTESVAYDFGREVVAYATLELSPEPPSHFHGFARFGTETATAAFMSEEAWFSWFDAKTARRELWDAVTRQLRDPALFAEAVAGDHQILLWKTGVGDGTYSVYTATSDDRLVGIVADFRTLPHNS